MKFSFNAGLYSVTVGLDAHFFNVWTSITYTYSLFTNRCCRLQLVIIIGNTVRLLRWPTCLIAATTLLPSYCTQMFTIRNRQVPLASNYYLTSLPIKQHARALLPSFYVITSMGGICMYIDLYKCHFLQQSHFKRHLHHSRTTTWVYLLVDL